MPSILLVDDDDLVLETVAGILADRGHEVRTAAHGREALGFLAEGPAVDAVILDIMMPEMEGIEALREIRKLRPKLPILMISGGDRSGWNDALDMAKKLGASRALPKPFTAEQLIQSLDEVLAEAKQR